MRSQCFQSYRNYDIDVRYDSKVVNMVTEISFIKKDQVLIDNVKQSRRIRGNQSLSRRRKEIKSYTTIKIHYGQ